MDPETIITSINTMFDGVQINPPSISACIALATSVALLLCSGFISASEIAFFSLSPHDMSLIEKEETNADRHIIRLLGDSERLLATILISNNFINVTIIMLLNYFFAHTINWGGSVVLQFVVVTIVLTFLLLLFGEIMPKLYSAQHTLQFTRRAAAPLSILKKIFRPLASVLVKSSGLVHKMTKKKQYNMSVDELSQALELTDKKEISDESHMLEGIIRFGAETAKEVMTSRLDMLDLDITTPYPEVLTCIVDNAYSRIPVYAKTRDNIKGVLYIKDLLPHLGKPDNFRWQSLIRPAYFVPETKMIDDLLREFQQNKVHIAIVVDEYGGTSGMVTMEDIIEEIVGEINDEYDDDDRSYVKVDDNTYIFLGKVLLSDFNKILNLDGDEFGNLADEADTVAGLLLEIKGEFPKLHEKINYGPYHFQVMAMDTRRIVRVKVEIDTPKKSEE